MNKSESGICRVCLAKSKTMYVYIHEKYKDSCISDYIRAIADVQIYMNDGLPDRICSSCLVELEQAVQFKQKCESSHHILTSTPPVIKTEDETDIKDIIVKEEEPTAQFSEPDCDDQCEDNEDLKVNDKSEVKKSKAIDLHLQCDDCKELFKSKCKLRVHWKKVHLYEALKCPECKRIFKSFKAFKSHKIKRPQSCKYASKFRIEAEGKKRVFHCKECTYSSKRMQDIITHIVVHTGERPFNCHICFKTFSQHSSLKTHQEAAHPEHRFDIPCHVCGKIIKGRSKLYRHMMAHSESKWSCSKCSKKFKYKQSFVTHMKIHIGVKSYTCEICEKDFFSSSTLANHRRFVHEKRMKMYKCDFCDYSSKNEIIITKHKVKHNDNNISCTVCGMFFESKQKLILHQRRHFEKSFECMYCEKKFNRRDKFCTHIKKTHKICEMPEQYDLALKKKSKHNVKDSKKVIEED